MRPPDSTPPPPPPYREPAPTQLDRIEAKLDALLDALADEVEDDEQGQEQRFTLDGEVIPHDRLEGEPL